jgi:hypothetical protein
VNFVVAVPQVLLSEDIEGETPEDALRGLRDSGGFSKAMTELMGAGDFDDLIGNSSQPVTAFVIDPNFQVTVWEMEIGWRRAEPQEVPF